MSLPRFKFSNFIPFETPLLYDGILYHTVENYFQAMKTLDHGHRLDISKATPGQAKKFGRRVTPIRSDWEKIKHNVMEFALRHKYAKGTKQHEMLMAEDPEKLVEYNTHHDNYWGVCACKMLNRSGNHGCSRGQNHLGKLLKKLQAEFKSGVAWLDPWKCCMCKATHGQSTKDTAMCSTCETTDAYVQRPHHND